MMLYHVGKFLARVLFSTLFRFELKGVENIPSEGGAILISNHISNFDPPLIGCKIKRKIYYMAKEELFKGPIMNHIMRSLLAFPIKRGKADLQSLKNALSLLKSGNIVVLFPEGTRRKEGRPQKVYPGVAWLAAKSKVQIVPAAIKGPYKLFGKITVTIGKPFSIEEDTQDKKLDNDELTVIVEGMMKKVHALLEA